MQRIRRHHLRDLALLAVLQATPGLAAGDAARGAQLYEQRCSGCHSLDAHRVGPMHRNVVGRRAGAASGYDYSPALRESRIRWDEATLAAWLADPEKLIPGQRMSYAVGEAGDRADLAAYLRSVSK